MKRKFKNIIYLLSALLISGVALMAEVEIINPQQKGKTAFAIIIDRATYEQAGTGVQAYHQSVENDGLAVYTVIDDWADPEAVKDAVRDLAGRKPALEGIVLIGDIPIPMIRDAQHLASAFKIRQDRYEWIDTSIPTDRFYDDFDLEFTFIQQDTTNPLLFYYTLNADSPQKIDKEIYSGRILPPGGEEVRIEKINQYLLQVAKSKAENNRLDNMLAFAGHGYHSESVMAWADEQLALRESFPGLYGNDGQLTYFYHTMSTDLKNTLIRELQTPELDLALFHAHGTEDSQLLIGYPTSSAIANNVEAVRLFVRSKLRAAERRGRSVEDTKAGYVERYGIPDEWFAGAFDDSVKLADSIYAATLDILIDDIKQMEPQAEIMIFDECFNGAFMLDSYVAGEYVFGGGTTIAGIANSVNVKQDIWTDEYLGLLGEGIRVGQMHRNWNFIESHIIGDPTYHYSCTGKSLNSLLAGDNQKTSFWRKLLRGDSIPLKVLAINKLTETGGWKSSVELVELYKNSDSYNVRMAALKSLAILEAPEFSEVLKTSLNDSYELIRRMSAIWMAEVGSNDYIPVLAESIVHDPARRVNFQAKNAVQTIDAAAALEAINVVLENTSGNGYKKDIQYNYRASLERTQEWLHDDIMVILPDTSLPVKKRLTKVRTFRNYKFHSALPELMKLALDDKEDPALRTALLEAFGWYHYSPHTPELITTCQAIATRPDAPDQVKNEALKTVHRLQGGINNPLSP